MAKIFLDTNILIDLLTDRSKLAIEQLDAHQLCISTLSLHIFSYLLKIKIPSDKLKAVTDTCTIHDFTSEIYQLAAQGPTSDLEDNIQLHSSALAECEYFLTRDKELLKMIYFGKTKIVSEIE